MTTKTNPHRWFFAYVHGLEGYDSRYAELIRAGIVSEYTEGATDSLSDMYKNHKSKYIKMKNELTRASVDELDTARKRVIAVLFSYLRFIGYSPDLNYVKEVARRAEQAKSFNQIPLTKLKQLYRIFGEKRNNEADAWVTAILTKISEDTE